LGELHAGIAPGLDLEISEALADEQLLELRLFLEVVLLVAQACKVKRRDGDVDVSAFE
jgi:hypothetical protein